MTCIIGLVENGEVYIGADGASSNGHFIENARIEKVFRNGKYVIAYTSSFRMGQLLQYCISLPDPPEKVTLKFMVEEFIEIVRDEFKKYGYSKVESNEETGGTFIVGVNNSLFHVYNDYQVGHYQDGFTVDGSGRYFAVGAMEALKDFDPEPRIARSIEIAGKFCTTVLSEGWKIIKV